MSRVATDFLARAHAGWGDPPDWILALATACASETQAGLARRLAVSGSQLSQALANRYPGDMARLEDRVRGALMGVTVVCPVLGEIGRDQCIREQAKPWSSASSVRVRLHRACRDGCPHSSLKERT
ncbi:MAG: hypothetical protein B7Y12_02005 [Rhizobiales bacterium 24-66-13]|jgi:hypothetical protein|nr:MAG: hypothetical protein B7Z41_03860 [Rhizobiales bacterium 12-66-7]OYY88795.1 MAG: hypothetical protein B7Y61_01035 [Rhizobiales bacterium 35-66-30]OYZ82790.1 MAG: hypothetical protein B7Y12_02005 [Rhizobiales bacterium 24-66-13]OZB11822.1 MAG: hypothetical protein B7X67_01985 [Rhizobiales bacterium 39-66-18]HQS09506.1 transcriptional regulator [Xanthobacteraceae bacterium]